MEDTNQKTNSEEVLDGTDVVLIRNEDLFPGEPLPFSVYLCVAEQYVLFRAEGSIFNREDHDRLRKNQISELYISKHDQKKYMVYFDSNISSMVSDTSMSIQEKSYHLIKNAALVVEDIFRDPENPQTFTKSQTLVRNFVDFLDHGPSSLHALIGLSVHDFYTYTHSVGVMTYAIALASQIGIDTIQTLQDIGMAGLFHDVGKTRIPLNIINKPGPLNRDEWEIMKKHSGFSFDIVAQHDRLPEIALAAIKQHHENALGTGYPEGIRGARLFLPSKLLSVCDIYNAITTDRPYSKKQDPFEALRLMKTLADKGTINRNLFQNFVLMIKG